MLVAIAAYEVYTRGIFAICDAVAVAIYPAFPLTLRRHRLYISRQTTPINAIKVVRKALFKAFSILIVSCCYYCLLAANNRRDDSFFDLRFAQSRFET